jgi:hypothetical protein
LLASLVASALVASAGWAAKPGHAAVTLGSDLATAPGGTLIAVSCNIPASGRGCLFVNNVIPGRELVSPFDGVIVRWRVRLGSATEAQSIRIRVVRRFDADQFTVITSGGARAHSCGRGHPYVFGSAADPRRGPGCG